MKHFYYVIFLLLFCVFFRTSSTVNSEQTKSSLKDFFPLLSPVVVRETERKETRGAINVLFMLRAFVIQDRSRENEYS